METNRATYIKDAHTMHCCNVHGCKYGDDNCTVANGIQPMDSKNKCVDCAEEENELISDRVLSATVDVITCPVCGGTVEACDEIEEIIDYSDGKFACEKCGANLQTRSETLYITEIESENNEG